MRTGQQGTPEKNGSGIHMVGFMSFLNKTTNLAKSQSKISCFIHFFDISIHFRDSASYNKYNDRSSYKCAGSNIFLSSNSPQFAC